MSSSKLPNTISLEGEEPKKFNNTQIQDYLIQFIRLMRERYPDVPTEVIFELLRKEIDINVP